MRTSCNGCRVLRKGCCEKCEIRPCIEWIKSPESQANATLFLAKFYGRAGLLNLINAGAQHQRPGIFKSLLYEACGRIVNPTFGSVGLLSSGNWAQCQAAVDAVLAGSPIVETNAPVPYLNPNQVPPVNSCDIRHVSKDTSSGKNKNRFKRSMTRPKIQLDSIPDAAAEWRGVNLHEFGQCSSGGGERSMQSVESVEAPWEMIQMKRGKPNPVGKDEKEEVGLELTLGSGFGKLNGKQ